jgi:hypothetical protein
MLRKLNYASNEEFYESLRMQIIKKQQDFETQRLQMIVVLRMLLESGEIKMIESLASQSMIPCMPNFDTQRIERGYDIVAEHLMNLAHYYDFSYSINKDTLERRYEIEFRTHNLTTYAQLPNHLLNVESGVYDLMKQKFTTQLHDENGNEYYIPENMNYDIVSLEKVDQNMLKVVKKIFNDWSQGDQTKLEFLKSLVLAAALGEGFKKYVIIQVPDVSVTSMFLNMIKGVVGSNKYARFDIQNLENDSCLSMLNDELNVILGDNLENQKSSSAKVVSRLKQLTSSNEILVSRGSASSMYVRMNGLKIQVTNEFPQFIETDDATLDRVIVYQWPNVHNRVSTREHKKIKTLTKHSLDELVGGEEFNAENTILNCSRKEFYAALMSWIVHTTQLPTIEIFNRFQDMFNKEIKRKNELPFKVLEEVFVLLDKSGAFEYRQISVNAIYHRYVEYLKSVDSNVMPVDRKSMTNQLQKYLKKYPHIEKSNELLRLRSVKYTACNIREFTEGIELSIAKTLSKYAWLREKSMMFENTKAHHILDSYSDQQINVIMNEIVRLENSSIDDIYKMSKYEFEHAYKTHESEITKTLLLISNEIRGEDEW